jgi:hypothetical protein
MSPEQSFSSGSASSANARNTSGTSPEAIAEELIARWRAAPESVIAACRILVGAVEEFGPSSPAFSSFLGKLVSGKVLSENDALSGMRKNGKLSMLKKIGEHADLLLSEPLLPLLSPGYSVLYQIALLIEDVGFESAKSIVASLGPGFVREDIISAKPNGSNPPPADQDSQDVILEPSELLVATPSKREIRLFGQTYAEADALDRSLRRPHSAENSGLVILIPMLAFGVAERELLPLLGFNKISRVFLLGDHNVAEVTNRRLILTAERGSMRSEDLEVSLLADPPLDILAIADRLFPRAGRKCHLFADRRTSDWHSLVGSENWIEEPTS